MGCLTIELRGGPDQLARISRQLKEEANRGLRLELDRALREAVAPLRQALPESARQTLPRRGGLADQVAASRVGVRRIPVSRGGGLRLVATNNRALRNLDRGRLRHPVFGRDDWVTQPVTPGWWSKPIEDAGPQVQAAVQEAVGRVADRIERAGRGL